MKCEFIKICKGYVADAYVCNREGGGPYCGHWRTCARIAEQKRKARAQRHQP